MTAVKENNQLNNEELPRLAGFFYRNEDRVMVIDLNNPRRNPIEMTYRGWLQLTTNYVIIGPANPITTNGNIKPFDKNRQEPVVS